MLARLSQNPTPPTAAVLDGASHALLVLPFAKTAQSLQGWPLLERLRATLRRRDMKLEELAKTPLTLDLASGGLARVLMIEGEQSAFERLNLLRRALAPILEEQPRELLVGLFGSAEMRRAIAPEALYVSWLNGVRLPTQRKKPVPRPLGHLRLYGARAANGFAEVAAVAEANTLCRTLTALPPNELTPAAYRRRLRQMARQQGWRCEEYDLKRLRRMGAGAFVAVAQGSQPEDAAIVHLSWKPRGARGKLALVGKGICFDTGGHNLKPARYMAGMHEDMNGSAVALGLMQALIARRTPLQIDAWLAIAQNHLSPGAYKQNDIVTALDGTTIEIVHTDAEGRMVLADTLNLASTGTARQKPDLVLDFATLTGSMGVALGNRYSGVFATSSELAGLAVAAGAASGERVCPFPLDADYEAGLESKVADIKQCTLEGEADHILAARFLKRFTHDCAWLHMDLSASNCPNGLGAVASDQTGFGVAWGVAFVEQWLAMRMTAVGR